MNLYDKLQKQALDLHIDLGKFANGNHAAGTRVRKQLAEIKRTCQAMRNEVQDTRIARKSLKQ